MREKDKDRGRDGTTEVRAVPSMFARFGGIVVNIAAFQVCIPSFIHSTNLIAHLLFVQTGAAAENKEGGDNSGYLTSSLYLL